MPQNVVCKWRPAGKLHTPPSSAPCVTSQLSSRFRKSNPSHRPGTRHTRHTRHTPSHPFLVSSSLRILFPSDLARRNHGAINLFPGFLRRQCYMLWHSELNVLNFNHRTLLSVVYSYHMPTPLGTSGPYAANRNDTRRARSDNCYESEGYP